MNGAHRLTPLDSAAAGFKGLLLGVTARDPGSLLVHLVYLPALLQSRDRHEGNEMSDYMLLLRPLLLVVLVVFRLRPHH